MNNQTPISREEMDNIKTGGTSSKKYIEQYNNLLRLRYQIDLLNELYESEAISKIDYEHWHSQLVSEYLYVDSQC